MLTDFNNLPDSSRIWVYASDAALSEEQQRVISTKIGEYLKTWEYHKNPLTAAVTILENHFIIIALDDSEYGVGGCSIDSLQRIILDLEKELSLSFLNRLNVFCKIDNEIQCIPSFKLGTIAKADTLFYDLTILTKSDLNTYLKPISKGWCVHLL
ncbi:MAG: hypothetical protein H8E84_03885 [Flavobacteriales bacterium]|nr:hypothetical protein [Flavobacteriales bacterium]